MFLNFQGGASAPSCPPPLRAPMLSYSFPLSFHLSLSLPLSPFSRFPSLSLSLPPLLPLSPLPLLSLSPSISTILPISLLYFLPSSHITPSLPHSRLPTSLTPFLSAYIHLYLPTSLTSTLSAHSHTHTYTYLSHNVVLYSLDDSYIYICLLCLRSLHGYMGWKRIRRYLKLHTSPTTLGYIQIITCKSGLL